MGMGIGRARMIQRETEKEADRKMAAAGMGVVVLGTAAILLLSGLMRYADRDTATRVSMSHMALNGPMTGALNDANLRLPVNVSSLHCWFKDDGLSGEGMASAVYCDAALTGRAASDVGNSTYRYVGILDNTDPSSPNLTGHRYLRDTRDLIATEFNFEIRRADSQVGVYSNVDEKRLTFDETVRVTNAVVTMFYKEASEALERAQANASDTVNSSWPSSSPHA